MEMLEKARQMLAQMDPQQTLLGACLLLVLLMLAALLLIRNAEQKKA